MSPKDYFLFWTQIDFLAFALSVVIAGLLIPRILVIAHRKQLFDKVNERKVHKGVVPRLGGLSFFPSYLFSLILVVAFNIRIGNPFMLPEIQANLMPMYLEICAIIVMYLVGIADDLIGVKYKSKFAAQVIAGCLMAGSGMYLTDFYGILGLHHLPVWLGWIFTIFAVLFVVNAINLIDGIDGLASGLSMIALGFYSVVFFRGGEFIYSMLAAAVAGTLLPFFYFNVFGDAEKHRKIFMGDTGALTTGMVLAFCAVAIMRAKPDFLDVDYSPAIVAISPLIIPCFDVCRVYLHRVKRGRNPFLPDKAHIHHKLLALGMNQKWALLTILLASLGFTGINIVLSPYVDPNILLLADILIFSGANMLLTKAIRARESRLGEKFFD